MTTIKENQAEDKAIDERASRIEAKRLELDAMSDSDPQKLPAKRMLNGMRYDQSAAMMTRSMAQNGSQDLDVRDSRKR